MSDTGKSAVRTGGAALAPQTEPGSVGQIEFDGRRVSATTRLGEIDLDDLRGEVRIVGGHVIFWAAVAAQAQAVEDRAEQAIDVVKARVAQEFRREKLRMQEKITEPMVEEHVTLHPEVQAAIHAKITARERALLARGVRDAEQEKQRTINSLTGLLYAEPTAAPPVEVPNRRAYMPPSHGGGRAGARRRQAERSKKKR